MSIEGKTLADLMAEDLAKSGLETEDMLARILDDSVRTAVGLTSTAKGYVIPYFDMGESSLSIIELN